MTREQIDAFQHVLIRQRILALMHDGLTGRKLAAARELLAFTIVGHARWFPECPASQIMP